MGRAASPAKSVADVSGFSDVPDTAWLPGVVRSVTNYGAFVAVSPPDGGAAVDGLLHISQIKEGFIEDPGEELELEQEVSVRVLKVEVGAGRLALSMRPKASAESPAELPAETA